MWKNIKKLFKTIPSIVAQLEKDAKDGRITDKERKGIAMLWCKKICEEFDIKFNFFVRMACSVLINWAAEKLPSKDIILPVMYEDF